MDNLWTLGGEIIRDVHMYELYDVPPLEKVRNSVDECGGPLCRHLDSKTAQESYDSTCRKFHKFLETYY